MEVEVEFSFGVSLYEPTVVPGQPQIPNLLATVGSDVAGNRQPP